MTESDRYIAEVRLISGKPVDVVVDTTKNQPDVRCADAEDAARVASDLNRWADERR